KCPGATQVEVQAEFFRERVGNADPEICRCREDVVEFSVDVLAYNVRGVVVDYLQNDADGRTAVDVGNGPLLLEIEPQVEGNVQKVEVQIGSIDPSVRGEEKSTLHR